MDPEIIISGLHTKLAEAQREIDAMRVAMAKGDPAAGFFLAAYQVANRTIAELRVELAKERERTAGMLGAGPLPDAPDREQIKAEVQMVRDLGVHGASAATYTVLAGAVRAAFDITHVQSNGKPLVADVRDVLLKALAAASAASHRSQP